MSDREKVPNHDGHRENGGSGRNADQPLGLQKLLPEMRPPGWLDANIHSLALEQAKLNAQNERNSQSAPKDRSAPATRQRKNSWFSSSNWLPWAGSIASLGVVLLLVTGQPLQQDSPQQDSAKRSAEPDSSPSVAKSETSTDAQQDSRQKSTPDSSQTSEVRAANEAMAGEVPPPALESNTAPAGVAGDARGQAVKQESAKSADRLAQSAKPRRNTPGAIDSVKESANPLPTPGDAPPELPEPTQTNPVIQTAPSVQAPQQVQSAPVQSAPVPASTAQAASPVQSPAPASAPANPSAATPGTPPSFARSRSADSAPAAARELAKSREPLSAETARKSAGSPAGTAASVEDDAAAARADEAAPQTPDRCIRMLEDLLLSNRKNDAQRLLRWCTERFPEQVWSTQLRERIGISDPAR